MKLEEIRFENKNVYSYYSYKLKCICDHYLVSSQFLGSDLFKLSLPKSAGTFWKENGWNAKGLKKGGGKNKGIYGSGGGGYIIGK